MAFATVEKVSLPRGRYETEVSMGKAGSWVLLDGVDANILKTATITSAKNDFDTERDLEIFKPLRFTQAGGEAVMKRQLRFIYILVLAGEEFEVAVISDEHAR